MKTCSMCSERKANKAILLLIAIIAALLFTVPVHAATLQGGRTKGTAATMKYGSAGNVGRITDTKKSIWYKFKTQKYDAFYNITIKNLSNPGSIHVYLMDANKEEVASKQYIYKNGTMAANTKLKKGRWYYINIVNNGTGSGNVKVSVTARKDAVGDSRKYAKAITKNQNFVSSMDGSKDVDYLKIKPAKTGYYSITAKNLSSTGCIHFYFMDKYEEELAQKKYVYKNGTLQTKLKLKKNCWYYIRIENGGSGTGNYRVTVR